MTAMLNLIYIGTFLPPASFLISTVCLMKGMDELEDSQFHMKFLCWFGLLLYNISCSIAFQLSTDQLGILIAFSGLTILTLMFVVLTIAQSRLVN